MKKYLIKITCPHCEKPVFMVYEEQRLFSSLDRNKLKNMLQRLVYKPDYKVFVYDNCTETKLSKVLYHTESLESIVNAIISLRLSRVKLVETRDVVYHFVDRFVCPSLCAYLGTTLKHYYKNGKDYTFFSTNSNEAKRNIFNILVEHGFECGISMYGNVYTSCEIVVRHKDHPLFKHGVFEVYKVETIHGYVYKEIYD